MMQSRSNQLQREILANREKYMEFFRARARRSGAGQNPGARSSRPATDEPKR
jgi:hypothetical protein